MGDVHIYICDDGKQPKPAKTPPTGRPGKKPRTVTLDNGETFYKDGQTWRFESGRATALCDTPLFETIDRCQDDLAEADDEIERLRAENERLLAYIERLGNSLTLALQVKRTVDRIERLSGDDAWR